jgi:Asp-tRNA(Asn)/Glu-tRNA(Gln) amidotransferase B subunit
LEDVIEDKGWLRTFRDPKFIEEIVETAIVQNPKLVRKYLKNRTQKSFDPIVQTIMRRSLDVDMALVTERLKEKLDGMKDNPVCSV